MKLCSHCNGTGLFQDKENSYWMCYCERGQLRALRQEMLTVSGQTKVEKGKHKGKTFEWIWQNNRQYFKWTKDHNNTADYTEMVKFYDCMVSLKSHKGRHYDEHHRNRSSIYVHSGKYSTPNNSSSSSSSSSDAAF